LQIPVVRQDVNRLDEESRHAARSQGLFQCGDVVEANLDALRQ
jgi:hypothetical protein